MSNNISKKEVINKVVTSISDSLKHSGEKSPEEVGKLAAKATISTIKEVIIEEKINNKKKS